MQMLALKEIHMTYGKGDGVVHALRGVDMEVERGELLAVTGKSGCGKSTLLNILGGVCKPTGGSYFFEGKEVSQLIGKGYCFPAPCGSTNKNMFRVVWNIYVSTPVQPNECRLFTFAINLFFLLLCWSNN